MTHIKGNPYAGHAAGYEPPASYWKEQATKQNQPRTKEDIAAMSASQFTIMGMKAAQQTGARQETWGTRLEATKDAQGKGLSPNEYEIRVVDVDIAGTMRKQFT